MGKVDDLQAAIGLIYEAVLDSSLWPTALNRLADTIGVAQIVCGTFDARTHAFNAIAPRIDPLLVKSYENYWAYRAPIWPKIASLPNGRVAPIASLLPREEYIKTEIYREWFRPAKIGFSILGANLRDENQFSTTIFAASAPFRDHISGEQALAFKAALPHFSNAFQLHRLLRVKDLDRDTAPDRLEQLGLGVVLVDSGAKVLFANAWARALLTPGSGLVLKCGYLFSTDRAASLHRAIASCAGRSPAFRNFGTEIALRRSRCRPLRVTVTPLRARGNVAELPWLGVLLPAALITISDPAMQKQLN